MNETLKWLLVVVCAVAAILGFIAILEHIDEREGCRKQFGTYEVKKINGEPHCKTQMGWERLRWH